MIQEAIQQYKQYFNVVEQVKKFELIPAAWSIEGGELTPSLKLKRKVILEKYQHLINSMY